MLDFVEPLRLPKAAEARKHSREFSSWKAFVCELQTGPQRLDAEPQQSGASIVTLANSAGGKGKCKEM
jgi:hypothetical protein